jgi:hypothetical protein
LCNENIYIAPLKDAVLIGLDFMSKHKTALSINKGYIYIQGQKLPYIGIKVNNSVLAVKKSKVMIQKKSQIPPKSLLRITCSAADHRLNNGLLLIEHTVNLVLTLAVILIEPMIQ